MAALDILNRIEKDRAFSSVLLPQAESNLSPADRGFCHELVLGVLRRKMHLDAIIKTFVGERKLDIAVRNALRMGAYQIKWLDRVPTYSAIDESVTLVRVARKTSAKGFVNAVLRRISTSDALLEFTDEVDKISIEASHPRWLIEEWISDFGPSDAAKIAAANNEIPKVAFREVGSGNVDLSAYTKSEFVNGAYIAQSSDKDLRDMADAGQIYFQDEASQLVASAAARDPKGRFLDVCAAPGGKTTLVAKAYSGSDAALIVAGDLHESRINLLRSTFERQRVDSVNVVRYDAEKSLPFADESFDTVLVDAPCSGTGTIRHNPEIRYFLEPGDFAKLAKKQLEILRNASNLVRRGGRLIYSTCSIQLEENEAVCEQFLVSATSFDQERPDVPETIMTNAGFARTFPHRDGTDGFFIAEFRRRV